MSDSNAKHFDEEVESWEFYTGKPRSAEINEPTHLPILDSFYSRWSLITFWKNLHSIVNNILLPEMDAAQTNVHA